MDAAHTDPAIARMARRRVLVPTVRGVDVLIALVGVVMSVLLSVVYLR